MAAGITCLAIMAHRHAVGGDAIKPGRVEAYPTWHAVGLECSYTGDDNGNGSAEFVWRRVGRTSWRSGMEMTIDRERRLIWGSVWPLDPGVAIEVAIHFRDADAARISPLRATAATSEMKLELNEGKQVWVSPNGNDAGPGTRKTPYRTIARSARGRKPGDVVHVLPGLYEESLKWGPELKGSTEQPIMFIGEGTSRPVVDASAEIPIGATWKNEGDGLFSHPAPGRSLLVTQDDRRMFGYRTLAELRDSSIAPKRAFFHNRKAARLYLATGDDKPPKAHRYRLSQQDHGFYLNGASHVAIRNFDIRHTGRSAVRIDKGGDGNAILHNAMTNCAQGVSVDDSACDNTAIWHNVICLQGQTDYTWAALMGELHWEFPRDGVFAWASRGTSIFGNRIDGYMNLITLEPPPKARDEAVKSVAGNRDLDVLYNQLLNASDDALELDFGGVNMRVGGNHVRNANSGVSIAPCVRGPVYVSRNTFTFRTLMFKFGIGGGTSHGAAYCDHNSGYGLTRDSGTGIYFNQKLPTSHKFFRNNLLILPHEDAVLAMRSGNTLDGNCYWRPNDELLKFQFGEKWLRGLEAFRYAAGMEKHGLQADPSLTNTPGLASYGVSDYRLSRAAGPGLARDPAEADFRLRPGSPCIDRGIPIPGLNDDFHGKTPDIGAHEFRPAGTK